MQPETPKIPVADFYHDVEVIDNYRWLEDSREAKVKQWIKKQNNYAREILDSLPNRNRIHEQIEEIFSIHASRYDNLTFSNEIFFILLNKPSMEQPYLAILSNLDDLEPLQVVVDPNIIDPSGVTAIDWYKPSPTGKLVAVSISAGGSEAGDLHIYESETGQEVFEIIQYINSGTAGGSLTWEGDESGFFYTRHFRHPSEHTGAVSLYQHVYFHQLGTDPSEDRYELGEGLPSVAEIQLAHDARTGLVLATIQRGDGGEFAHYLRFSSGEWRQFSFFEDDVVQAVFGPEGYLYLVSFSEAPLGKVLRVPIENLDVNQADVLIPESEHAIVSGTAAFWGEQTVLTTTSKLYVVYQLGGPSEIRVFNHKGESLPPPPQLPVSAVHGLTWLKGDDILFGNMSFIHPNAYYIYHTETGETRKTAISDYSPTESTDAMVVREFAVSKDGTQVPLNIVLREDARLDGSNPCIVTGYGGFGVNLTPRFRVLNRFLLDYGVIFIVANLRGGSEFGKDWYREGMLTNKQNVFDDFSAVLQHLVNRGYTKPSKTAIVGGSNGGLLMGAMITQNPQMIKAAVTLVGIYDMLRVELSSNGAFNVAEFGSVQNPEHFEALLAYSPYHNVNNGVSYPAVLLLTGENDPRVDSMQSWKMTARLQEATVSNEPIMLRSTANTGHGGNAPLSERITQTVDIYTLIFDQIGVAAR